MYKISGCKSGVAAPCVAESCAPRQKSWGLLSPPTRYVKNFQLALRHADDVER